MTMNISSIILAGGKSSRMGKDKCDLIFHNKTLLNIQIQKMKDLNIDDILVSGYKGTNCEETIIPDDFHFGPISGIWTCLKHIKHNKALVVSVDVPLLKIEDLSDLIKYSIDIEQKIVSLKHQEKVESLVSIYDKSLINDIEKIIATKNYSIYHLMDLVGYNIYKTNTEDRYFLNVNNQSDFLKLDDYK